jgi:hypothetical protein
MAEITAEISLEISRLKQGIDRSLSELRSFKQRAKTQGGDLGAGLFGGLKAAAAGAAAAVGAAMAAAGLGRIVSSAVEKAADAEQMQVTMEVLIGDTAKAKDTIENLRKLGASTPFEFADLADAEKKLLQFGLTAEESLPLISRLGDVAAGDANKLQSLALVFGQVSSNAKLTGGDLLQFINAGFNPLNEITKKTSESMAEVRQRMEAGGVSALEVKDALIAATSAGGLFYGMNEKQSKTLGGMWSTLKDEVSAVMLSFGTPVADALRPMLAQAITMAADLKAVAAGVGEAFLNAVNLLRAAWETLTFDGAIELLGEALKIAFLEAINFLYKGMMASLSAFGQLMIEQVKNAITLFQILTTKDFWSGMLNALVGIAQTFNSIIFGVIAAVLETVKKLPGGESLVGGGDQFMRDMSAQSGRDAADSFSAAGADLTPAVDAAMSRIAEAAANIAGAFQESFAGTAGIFDTTEDMENLRDAFSVLQDRAEEIAAEAKAASPVTTAAAKTGEGGKVEKTAMDRSPGLFASALNVLMGRSAAEVAVEEAKKSNALLETIAKNTATKSQPNVTEGDSVPRFV